MKTRRQWQAGVILALVVGVGPVSAAPDRDLDQAVASRDATAIVARMRALADDAPVAAVMAIPVAYAKVEELSDAQMFVDDRFVVFKGAIGALGRVKDGKALDKLKSSFPKRKKWQERVLILHAALHNPGLDPEPLALRGTQDKAPLVVALAAWILGNTQKVSMLAPLLSGMEKWETLARREKAGKGRKEVTSEAGGRAWLACRDALNKLTGKSFHMADDYRNYIDANRGKIDPRKVDLEPDEEIRTAVGLFGLDITGRNIVFILDVSGSMLATDPPTEDQLARIRGRTVVPGERDELLETLMESRRRIVRAKKELTKVVQSLGEDRRFNLVVYSTDTHSWQKRLVKASSGKKEQAVAYIQALQPNGVTFTDEALDAAFVDPYVDTIYLITDGAPTHIGSQGADMPSDAPGLMDRILKTTRARNYLRNVRLFTLGFQGAKEEWLTRLAKENHGVYHRIE